MFRTRTLYEALQGTRSFLSLQELSDNTEVQWRLLRPLLEAGFGVEGSPEGAQVASLGDEEKAILVKCLKNGHLISHQHPVRGELYSCNTPLHLYYLQHQILSARAEHVLPGSKSFAAFVRAIITRLSPQRLMQTLSVGASSAGNVLLERKLQMDLHAAALTLVPRDWNVCPDVGKVCWARTTLCCTWCFRCMHNRHHNLTSHT